MAENPTVKLGVLISGTGSNLQAIIDAILRGDLKAEIRLVISNRADAQGLERARRHGIETGVIEHRNSRRARTSIAPSSPHCARARSNWSRSRASCACCRP